MAYLAQLLGALIVTFLVSRLLYVPLRHVGKRGTRAAFVAIVTAVVCVVIGTFGKGFVWAVSLYPLASFAWWLVDVVRGRRVRPPGDAAPPT